jgi:chromosome segregation ATPase
MPPSNFPPGKLDVATVLVLLNRIQDDINKLEDKWDKKMEADAGVSASVRVLTQTVGEIEEKLDKHIESHREVRQSVHNLSADLGKMTKVLSLGNGQPSVLAQLHSLHEDVKSLKRVLGAKTPDELRTERYRAVGKVAGLIALVAPGILAFIQSIVP